MIPLLWQVLAGLQTRTQVNSFINEQVATGGPNAQSQFQQNIQQGQSQMQQLKNKLMQLGGGSSDDIMPQGFKPNNQKTKILS
jgi:Tfp pilus assembly PilM family ATPase